MYINVNEHTFIVFQRIYAQKNIAFCDLGYIFYYNNISSTQ